MIRLALTAILALAVCGCSLTSTTDPYTGETRVTVGPAKGDADATTNSAAVDEPGDNGKGTPAAADQLPDALRNAWARIVNDYRGMHYHSAWQEAQGLVKMLWRAHRAALKTDADTIPDVAKGPIELHADAALAELEREAGAAK